MIFLRLFYEFFKTGLFAIGGGLATLPFLYDMSDKTGWFTHQQLADMIAISESTPGPLGVNMATYVGYLTGGVLGALVATIALIVPSLIIIYVISLFLKTFRDSKYVQGAFYGLRPASTGLITAAGFSVLMISLVQWDLFKTTGNFTDLFFIKGLILAAAVFAATKLFKKLHPALLILASAVVGIVFRFGQ